MSKWGRHYDGAWWVTFHYHGGVEKGAWKVTFHYGGVNFSLLSLLRCGNLQAAVEPVPSYYDVSSTKSMCAS